MCMLCMSIHLTRSFHKGFEWINWSESVSFFSFSYTGEICVIQILCSARILSQCARYDIVHKKYRSENYFERTIRPPWYCSLEVVLSRLTLKIHRKGHTVHSTMWSGRHSLSIRIEHLRTCCRSEMFWEIILLREVRITSCSSRQSRENTIRLSQIQYKCQQHSDYSDCCGHILPACKMPRTNSFLLITYCFWKSVRILLNPRIFPDSQVCFSDLVNVIRTGPYGLDLAILLECHHAQMPSFSTSNLVQRTTNPLASMFLNSGRVLNDHTRRS